MSPDDYAYEDFGDLGQCKFYFFEPAITAGVGCKWVKLRGQYVVSQKMSAGDISYYTDPVFTFKPQCHDQYDRFN